LGRKSTGQSENQRQISYPQERERKKRKFLRREMGPAAQWGCKDRVRRTGWGKKNTSAEEKKIKDNLFFMIEEKKAKVKFLKAGDRV